MAKAISLTAASGGSLIVLDTNIKKIVANGTGADVSYWTRGAGLKLATVTQTPAQVAALCTLLINFTDLNDGTIYLNAADVETVITTPGTNGSNISINLYGAGNDLYQVQEQAAAVASAINDAVGSVPNEEVGLLAITYDFATKSISKTWATTDVDIATDTITVTAHGFSDGDTARLTTTGAVPTGLATATTYFVVGATLNTFQLAATYGGAAINLTDVGSGVGTIKTNTIGVIRFPQVNLPSGAIIKRAYTDVITTFTSATDAATIGLGFVSDGATSIKAALAISNGANFWDAGFHDCVQDGTAANFFKLTAERDFIMTVASEVLTAGKMNIFVEYVVAS
jgi:hypothetical protein